jgi:hypothetical protein
MQRAVRQLMFVFIWKHVQAQARVIDGLQANVLKNLSLILKIIRFIKNELRASVALPKGRKRDERNE